MGFIKAILANITHDPYFIGPRSHQIRSLWRLTYLSRTESGFQFKYTISCFVDKIDVNEFKANRMLEEESQRRLVDEWHSDVFLPKLEQLRCSFRYLSVFNFGGPALCRIAEEGGETATFFDQHMLETGKEIEKVAYQKRGCRVKFAEFQFERDEVLLKENYTMIRLKGLDAYEQTDEFKAREEALVVSLIYKQFELQREFQHVQGNQEHNSKNISVSTRLAGRAVEISWTLDRQPDDGFLLRGYRKEDGFAVNNSHVAGMCVVETRTGGKSVQHLGEGKEYFFTFLLTKEEPVYAKQDFIQGLVSSAPVAGFQTRVVDSLRFSVRVPTLAEISHVERMLDRVQQKPADTKQEKIRQAFEELTSFVEFEESISQWEKNLIAHIESKGYPPKERKEKIERLKAVVGALRMANMEK